MATALARIGSLASGVAAAAETDEAKARKLFSEIEPAWLEIQGTIRANDKDAHGTFEDSLAVLELAAQSGDGKRASDAAAAIAATARQYEANFPTSAEPIVPAPPEPAATTPAIPADTPPRRQAASPYERAVGPEPSEDMEREASGAPLAALPRTGGRRLSSPLALAGAALGLGGLAVIGGARRPGD